jgi:hypothetical protein
MRAGFAFYMMRHPIDRLVSHYIHEWSVGEVTGDINTVAVPGTAFVDYGCYAKQLEPYLDYYGRDRILPVFLERMKAAPEIEFKRVMQFLDGPTQASWQHDLGAQNISRERIRRFPLYDILVENPLMTTLRRTLLPQGLRDRVKAQFQMRDRPALSDDLKKELARVFDEDLARLGGLLTTPLSCENYQEVVSAHNLDWAPRG